MRELSYKVLKDTILKKGYVWYEDKLNVIGIRTNDDTSNEFNDFIVIAWKEKGEEKFIGFEATTDPGLYWRKKPINVKGTAILVPNQYIDTWQIGKHQGKYEAFVQAKMVSVYRDNNKDDKLDANGPIYKGFFGINLHRAGLNVLSIWVDKWSAGCQVFRRESSLKFLLDLFKKSKQDYLTYTLIEENDIV